MNYVTYCVCYVSLALGLVFAGVWLVVTEHYGWAWIPWLIICCLRWRGPDPDKQLPQGGITK
jgi:hypothetical protein